MHDDVSRLQPIDDAGNKWTLGRIPQPLATTMLQLDLRPGDGLGPFKLGKGSLIAKSLL